MDLVNEDEGVVAGRRAVSRIVPLGQIAHGTTPLHEDTPPNAVHRT
jgi:hypothetical protein